MASEAVKVIEFEMPEAERKAKVVHIKSKRKCLKNRILKTITAAMVLLFVICVCCIDSENATPFYAGIMIAYAWLIPFCIANKERLRGE